MQTVAERELVEALRQRLAIIADENSRRNPEMHMQRLRNISEQIAELSSALGNGANPQLAHYLARCSYDKALELLCPADS